MRVGIAGTGRMGSAMARRLLDLGHSVVIWNRSASRALALVESGAQTADSPRELAGRVDAVISMLTDEAALDAVYSGADGLLATPLANLPCIDMSTVRPAWPQAAGARQGRRWALRRVPGRRQHRSGTRRAAARFCRRRGRGCGAGARAALATVPARRTRRAAGRRRHHEARDQPAAHGVLADAVRGAVAAAAAGTRSGARHRYPGRDLGGGGRTCSRSAALRSRRRLRARRRRRSRSI